MDHRPGVATKAQGITMETIKVVASVEGGAGDSEEVPLGEDFVDFAVDSFRASNKLNLRYKVHLASLIWRNNEIVAFVMCAPVSYIANTTERSCHLKPIWDPVCFSRNIA